MPINAGPEFFAAKERYEAARTTKDKIRTLQEMISAAPKHKSSEHLLAQLKKKLADLKKELVTGARKKASSGGGGGGWNIRKEGDAQVVLLGYPSSGKSTILSRLTNAKPLIADYPYTTQEPEIGTMKYSNVDVQLIEIPAVSEGASESERGSALFSIVRNADGIVLVIDARDFHRQLSALMGEMKRAGMPGKPILAVVTKGTRAEAVGNVEPRVKTIEARDAGELKREIWEMLGKIRVYTRKGERTDERPMVMKTESTVRDFTHLIHKELLSGFRFARVWRKGSPYSGQRVGLDFALKDEDTVEIFA